MRHTDETRRQFLLRALAAGLFAAAPRVQAEVLGKAPRPLPPGKSIYSLNGTLRVNGTIAREDTIITANDTLHTESNSQAIFAVGHDAFILRENSELRLSNDGSLVGELRLVSGALLSVFGKSRHLLVTPTATIGIRGTGVYAEAAADVSYICTCYGMTEIASSNMPENKESISSKHHDDPRYITAAGEIQVAPFINHTDEELMLIETLVGRVTPFSLFDDGYGGPKRY
ncbi:MAG TPA: hypothetical protein VIE17_02730 [Methylophilaceae bacterium]